VRKSGQWKVVAASVAGAAHTKSGKGNEDAALCASLPDGTLILIAADGAGSAMCAAEGSSLCVQGALEVLQSHPLPSSPEGWETFLLELSWRVRSGLEEVALETDQTLKGFASTLLLAVVTKTHIAALQIGDGAIVIKTDSSLQRLTQPFRGDYASETIFLTSADFLEHASCKVVATSKVTAVALLTDGLEPVALNLAKDEPFAPFFEPLFSFAAKTDDAYTHGPELANFLNSERIQERTQDDKTLIVTVK